MNGQEEVNLQLVDAKDSLALPYGEVISDEGGSLTTDREGWVKVKSGRSYTFVYLGYESREVFISAGSKSGRVIGLSMSTQLLDQAVVTGNRSGQRLLDAIAPLDVMPASFLSHRTTPDITQMMNRMPGVQMVDGQISIRGGAGYAFGAGSRVALLLNGIPMLQPDAGTISWNDLPLELLQRTEIVKNSSTVLYGSAALNGVVQMKTWPLESDTTMSEVLFASRAIGGPSDSEKQWYDAPRMSYWGHATHSDLKGRFQWQGSLRWEDEENHLKDFYQKRARASFFGKFIIDETTEVGVQTLVNRSENNSFLYWKDAGSGANVGDSSSYILNEVLRWQIDPYFKKTYRDGRQHYLQGRIFQSENQATDNRGNSVVQYLLHYQYSHPTFGGLGRWVSGALTQAFQSSAALFGDGSFWSYNAAAFSQYEHDVSSRLTLMAGVRAEYNGQFPGIVEFNGEEVQADAEEWQPLFSAGLNYEPWRGFAVAMHWGQGYRFPTIAEKFIATALGPTVISPNPNLVSEIGESYNLSIKQMVSIGEWRTILRGDLFLMQYDNMIEFGLQNPVLGFQALNIGDTDIRGLEFSALGEVQTGDLSADVLLSYTYIDPTYRNFSEDIQARSSIDENILKYRVQHQGSFQLGLSWQGWQWSISSLYNSNMDAIDALLELFVVPGLQDYRRENSTAFWRWDMSFGYAWPRWRIMLDGENITNVEYSLRPGLLEAPRNISCQLQYRW